MKKKKSLFSTIVGIIIFCYVVVNSNILGDIKASIKEISKNATLVKEELQKETNVVMNQTMDIHFIDVGQADAILIRNNDKNVLIDAGNNGDGKLLTNYLQNLGISSFEHVFATHAHEDHIGGMDDIIKNFEIKHFYMPDTLTTTKTFEDVLDALINKNISYETPKIGDEHLFENSNIEILSVMDSEELNDTSIVLKLTYGKNCFLFTGDATKKVESSILNKDLKCDVLKVAHHGSSLSNSKEFLEKVSPEIAVISVGKDNSYKHPHDEVLKRLNDLNIKIYRTDEMGTIIISSDGEKIKIINDEKKDEE